MDAKTDVVPEGWTRREMKGIPASLGAMWTQKNADGSWRYGVRLDETHVNAQGFVHGGTLMNFMDHALSLLVWEASGRAFCSTIQLDNHFLTALKPPAFAILDGEITRQGKKLIFARGVLRVEEDAIMESTGVWSVTRPKQ